MDRTRAFDILKWPLLLVLAAAGLWFFGDMLDPRRGLSGEEGVATESALKGGSAPGSDASVSPMPENLAGDGGLRLEVQPDSSRVLVHGFSEEALEAMRGREEAMRGREGAIRDREGAMRGREGAAGEWLKVYALPEGRGWDPSLLPMDGSRRVSGASVRFDPRHDFLPEVRYMVRLELGLLHGRLGDATGRAVIDTTFSINRPGGLQPQRVTGVYPSADSLPQNLLKFYVNFSGPMSRDEAYEHISIRNADGEVVPDAFLELPQELWDPDVTRLTLLFDPGRIKRGLQRHNLMGVPFEPGRLYTLVVDSAMEDGNGLPIGETYRKDFVVTEPDREMPDHNRWTIDPPEPGTRGPLVMHLDEPMDRALLQRLVSVYLDDGGGMGKKVNGTHIPGSVETRDSERTWVFTPDKAWDKGNYAIEIGRVVEDLAGNNLISVFDVDLAEGADDPVHPAQPAARPGDGSKTGSVVVKIFKIIGE